MKRYLLQQDDVGIEEIISFLPLTTSEVTLALEEAAAQFIDDNEMVFDFLQNDCQRKIEVTCQEIDQDDNPIGNPIKINVYVEEHTQFTFTAEIVKEIQN